MAVIMDWVDCTPVGSSHEVQTRVRAMPRVTGAAVAVYRHRGVKQMYVCEYKGKNPSKVMVRGDGPWIDGLPPRKRNNA